jgi:hypothetical protein
MESLHVDSFCLVKFYDNICVFFPIYFAVFYYIYDHVLVLAVAIKSLASSIEF